MKVTKRCFALVLGVVMLLGLCSTAFAAGAFSDIANNAYYAQAVDFCIEHGLIGGTDDGIFSPDTALSRGMRGFKEEKGS